MWESSITPSPLRIHYFVNTHYVFDISNKNHVMLLAINQRIRTGVGLWCQHIFTVLYMQMTAERNLNEWINGTLCHFSSHTVYRLDWTKLWGYWLFYTMFEVILFMSERERNILFQLRMSLIMFERPTIIKLVKLFKFSATWGCVSLPRPTTSSGWKLLIFVWFEHKHLQIPMFRHTFHSQ